jgi:epoxyqueuosine reductase
LFSCSPVKRIGRNRFVRNVAIAIGNSGDQSLVPALRPLLDDPDPVVADAASWAFARLAPSSHESFGVSISPCP